MGSELQDAVTIDKVTVPYNPNLLVTYKAIAGTYAAPEEPTYLTSKVTEIEWDLHNGRVNKKALNNLHSTINSLEDKIIEWSDSEYSKEDVLLELCQHFDLHPTKTVEFSATITVNGSVDVTLDEIEDFNLEDFLTDSISVDSYNGNVVINDFQIEDANEN